MRFLSSTLVADGTNIQEVKPVRAETRVCLMELQGVQTSPAASRFWAACQMRWTFALLPFSVYKTRNTTCGRRPYSISRRSMQGSNGFVGLGKAIRICFQGRDYRPQKSNSPAVCRALSTNRFLPGSILSYHNQLSSEQVWCHAHRPRPRPCNNPGVIVSNWVRLFCSWASICS